MALSLTLWVALFCAPSTVNFVVQCFFNSVDVVPVCDVQDVLAFLLLFLWCSGWVSLPPTSSHGVLGEFSLSTTPLMVFRMGQPSSYSSHGVQEGSAFLPAPLMVFCSGWISSAFSGVQPYSHSWCSGWVSLSPTPLMVFRRGQPSSCSSHGVLDGSAFLPLLSWCSAFLPLLSWCSGWVSLPPTPLMVFSLTPTPLMVFRRGQPSSYSSHGAQDGSAFLPPCRGVLVGSAFLPLLSWCSALLPLLSWCSGWVSLPPTSSHGVQPYSHSSHGVKEGSAFLLLPSWCSGWVSLPPTSLMVSRMGQPSAHSSHGVQPYSHSSHDVQGGLASLPLLS